MRNFDLPGRSPVIAENGMAATSHPLATPTALQVLREGGNAVDAAIAASATLCVVEPHMTGIGGDCFAIVAEPDGTLHGLNGSGRAPAGAHAARYRELGHETMPQSGALSVTAPGAVDAWDRLLKRFGTLGFDRLFADAIRYAEEGYPVHHRVARDWAGKAADLAADEGAAMLYLFGGRAPEPGARHLSPALGRTLRTIAERGARAFYEGEIAAEMAALVRKGGGFLSKEDLAAVEGEWVGTIGVPHGGHEVHEIPPNGQGITALIMMRLLDHCGAGRDDPMSARRYHLEIEAGRLAYSVRDHLVADAAAMTATPAELLSDGYMARLADGLLEDRRNETIELPAMPSSDTVYLTVVDRERRAVSFINSLYSYFGAKLMAPRSGVALQNRGGCFSLEPGHPNEIGPRKRPMHTIIPAMATRGGRAAISFGVMGGDYQPVGHAHVFANIVHHRMDPQAALDHPRIFWGEDGVLLAESGIPAGLRAELERMGHQIRDAAEPHGGGQAIVIDRRSGFLIGGSDPRKDGCAMGW